jgi:chromate reductase
MSTPFTVLGIAGSLRRDSYNRSLVDHAAECAPEGVVFDVYDGLGVMPYFNEDLERDDLPPAVLDLRDRIEAADALLVVTPEYNSAMPGVLKNALDWASRPPGESALAGKPAAVMGASPGRFGAVRAQKAARMVLTAIGADVLDMELPVARVADIFSENRTVIDAEVATRIAELVGALVESADGPTPAPADLAAYSRACQEQLPAAG